MKFDKVLQYRWAGREIRRKSWCDKTTSEPVSLWLSDKDIDADDWEVMPKYVGLDEAWRALQKGKVIIGDDRYYDGNIHRKRFRLMDDKSTLETQNSRDSHWRHYGRYIPINWIDASNFEIAED